MISDDTLQLVKNALETKPNIWLAIGIAISPFITVGSIALFVVKYIMPAWEKQQEINRQRLSELLKERSNDAEKQVTATREIAKLQNDSLQEKIELKIDHLDERVKNNETLLRNIAAKMGVVIFLIFMCSFLFSKSNPEPQMVRIDVSEYRSSFKNSLYNSIDCDPACPKGFACCGSNKCCEDSSTASSFKQCSMDICK